MAEVSQELIEARAERAITGAPFDPHISGLEGLVLVRLDLAAQGQANLAYTRALQASHKEAAGARFSAAFVADKVKALALEVGIDAKRVLKKDAELTRRLYEKMPADLADPYPVTQAELAVMASEERAQHEAAMVERGQRMADFLADLYTEDEREIRDQAQQLADLERQLHTQTHEHFANAQRLFWELQWACRKADDPQVHYFTGNTAEARIGQMAATDPMVLVQLMQAWSQFKTGGHPAFFSRSSSGARPGGR